MENPPALRVSRWVRGMGTTSEASPNTITVNPTQNRIFILFPLSSGSFQHVAILVEDAASVAWREVHPLKHGAGEQPGDGFDVVVNEGVVAFASNSGVAVSNVHRVFQQTFPICTDIEHHRNHAARVNSASRCVNCQLANRYLDSAHAPVTNPKDLLGIGGENQVDLIWPGA